MNEENELVSNTNNDDILSDDSDDSDDFEEDEITFLLETIYNLTLYLNDIRDNHPDIFEDLSDRYSGMPGYLADTVWMRIEDSAPEVRE